MKTDTATIEQALSDVNHDYDVISHSVLTARLKRSPTKDEVTNSDNDSDLVNETLWQLICKLTARVAVLEKQAGIITQ